MKLLSSAGFKTSWLALVLIATCPGCKPKEEATQPAPPPIAPTPPISSTTNAQPESSVQTATLILTPEEARNHVGELATIKGKVERVHVSQKGDVFIDMGGKHPNAAFTVVCFKQSVPTDQLQALDGKVISVKGKIKEYQGKVEIVLDNAAQISQ